MASCLGIYLNEDIVKYAKVSMDSSKNFKVEQYGTRFVREDKKELINSIIDETNSKDIPVAINPQSSKFVEIEIHEQAQSKSYINDVLKMEFEAWCEKNQRDTFNYSYVYMKSDYKAPEINKYSSVMNIVENKDLEKITSMFSNNNVSAYPNQLLMHKIVPEEIENYVLVNLDDELSIITVIGKKVGDIKIYPNGMKQILVDLSQRLGSYQRAYEACKQINVYTEGRTENDPETEALIEQVLQEVLKYVLVVVNRNRKSINKVLITGTGTMFANIDILFTEFLDVKSEILKPDFISDNRNVKNMAEILEDIQAIALAYCELSGEDKNLNYIKQKDISRFSISDIFNFGKKITSKIPNISKNPNKNNNQQTEKTNVIMSGLDFEKFFPYILSGIIVVGVILIGYIIFSKIYIGSIDTMVADIGKKNSDINSKMSTVNSDLSYINTNATEYKAINNEVTDLVKQIETNQIGKFTTYNVATFLQKIIKIIPKNVQLKTISSDDNKKVKISAQSTSYADLGYFVAQLKLQGVLNSVTVNSVQNGQTIVIEIGGDLP